MDYALLGVVGIITVVTVARFAAKLGIAAPLVLVVVGIGFSYLPGVPEIDVEPELILAGVLPPLLYSAAIQVPLVDFRRNLRSIFGLSVLLVMATAFLVGLFLYAVLPDLSLAAAIALGAVVSPTDAVAATAIAKRLGLPPRLVTVLEGESLVNDASALVLLKAATTAAGVVGVSTGAESVIDVGEVGVMFSYSVVLAVGMGLLIGFVTVFVRSKLSDPVLDTAVSFAVPFLAYIPAEELGASGVLAVVVVGIYTGHNSARFLSSPSRISERVNWRTAQFLLENGVFLLMGGEIKAVIAEVHADDLGADKAVLLGIVVVGILAVVRFLFVWPLIAWLRRSGRNARRTNRRMAAGLMRLRNRASGDERFQRRQQRAERTYRRRENDLAASDSEEFGWRGGLVLSWSGMRGVVTVAAAQSLPAGTPYRPQLILIAFTVAVLTLLLQGGTLPWLIRAIGIQGSDGEADRRELAMLLDEVASTGIRALPEAVADLPAETPPPRDVLERVRRDTLLRSAAAWEQVDRSDELAPLGPHAQYLHLRRAVLTAEREALLEVRSRGEYSSRVLRRAQAMLDAEESRLDQDDTTHS